MTKIIIKDNRNEIVLETTDEKYEEDILNNKDKINEIWWRCQVEYDNGNIGYNYPYNHNGKSPRKIITVNERNIYADYNFLIEGHRNDTYQKLLDYLNEDFKTKNQANGIQNIEKERMKYLKETSSPINKHIEPVDDNLKKELLDD